MLKLKLQYFGHLVRRVDSLEKILMLGGIGGRQVQILRYSARAQTRLGVHFVPFTGPSSSGDKVFGGCTVPGGQCVLITSLVLAARFPGCAARAPSQVCQVPPLGS